MHLRASRNAENTRCGYAYALHATVNDCNRIVLAAWAYNPRIMGTTQHVLTLRAQFQPARARGGSK